MSVAAWARPGPDPDRLAQLAAAVDAVVAVRIDDLDDTDVRGELAALQRQARRIDARTTALATTLTERRAARAAAERPDDPRAGERADQDTRRELSEELRWTPSQTNKTVRTGRELETLDATREAFAAGRISADHVGVITRTLRHFSGEQRHRVEAELVAAACQQDAVALGRTARRLLADTDPDAAMRDLDRLHTRRYARVVKDPDGMVHLHAGLAGLDAEVMMTALDAFRTKDAPHDIPRSFAQSTADALVTALRAALDAGDAPARNRVRPHVTVVVDWDTLVASAGAGEAQWTGPIPAEEVRRLLDDSSITRVVTGPDGQPLDVGRARREPPPPLRRAVVARDRRCTWPGCDAPAAWCQAAHLDRRWMEGGGVSVGELALLCHRHHRLADRQRWVGTIEDGQVVWHRPDHRPDGPQPP